MARDYHPLDTRYKGPSTAYTGTAKRMPKGVGASVAAGPWDATSAPPPPRPPAPPPIPKHPRRQPRTGLRILLGIIIVIVIVGLNMQAMRSYSSLITDVETQMNAMEL